MAFFEQSKYSDVAKTESGKGKLTAKAESQEIIKSNRDRVCAIITNSSVKDAWIALGAKAVSEEGIYLKKEGGVAVIDFYTGAISIVGEGNIGFVEV